MKRFLLPILCLILLLGAVGCGEDAPQNNNPSSSVDESYAEQYVVDPVINRFLIAFKQQKRYTLAGMVQNTDLSCTAYIDVCQVTLRSTQRGLHFTLTGGNTEAQRNRMLDVFYSIAQVTDPSCTDTQMQTALNHFTAQTDPVMNHRVSNDITVNTYVPVIQTDTVQVDCRMEFTATNYLPEEE